MATAAIVAGIFAATPRAFAAPAGFSPTCTGKGCYNLDPVTQTNCSVYGYAVGGQTITSGYGTINLMYQQYCNANWAEADNLSAGVWIEVFNAEGEQVLYQPNYNWGYTSMVDGSVPAGVCIYNSGLQVGECGAQPGTYPSSVLDSEFTPDLIHSAGVCFVYPGGGKLCG